MGQSREITVVTLPNFSELDRFEHAQRSRVCEKVPGPP